LLKGGSWPSIATALYIYYIYFPVILDSLEQEDCEFCSGCDSDGQKYVAWLNKTLLSLCQIRYSDLRMSLIRSSGYIQSLIQKEIYKSTYVFLQTVCFSLDLRDALMRHFRFAFRKVKYRIYINCGIISYLN